jgi:peptidoglycan/LPS O-acetylase OafA/YrhL
VIWGNFAGTPTWVRVLYPTAVGLSAASLLPWATRLASGPHPFGAAVRWISLISYSLYLVHVPLRVVLYQVCFVKLHLPNTWTGEAVFQVVCWTAYLTAGTCLYYGFERPLMNLRDRWR